jgi:hypothetical protein
MLRTQAAGDSSHPDFASTRVFRVQHEMTHNASKFATIRTGFMFVHSEPRRGLRASRRKCA